MPRSPSPDVIAARPSIGPSERATLRAFRLADADPSAGPGASTGSAGGGPANGALPTDLVKEVQRMWILASVARLAFGRGVESLTVREIIERAGVSRRRFYELFDNRHVCFDAAFEDAIAKASHCALSAFDSGEGWLGQLRSRLRALLMFFDSEPELTWLCVLGVTTASPSSLRRRNEVLERVTAFIDDGRRSVPRQRQPPPLTGETVVGGMLSVIEARLLEPTAGPMIELLNPLMSVIALAYHGPRAADRELSRPVARGGEPANSADARHSIDLETRLTHHTLRVLAEIAARPGVSNRAVAEAAGIRDPAQISKLLARLERHGLVQNTGAGPAKGAPNEWTLTSIGAKVDRAVRIARGAQEVDE